MAEVRLEGPGHMSLASSSAFLSMFLSIILVLLDQVTTL